MADRYDGDPKIVIDLDGADFVMNDGQPEMDQGLENHTAMSLLTEPGWYGNDLETDPNRRVSSQFIVAARRPITRDSLIDTSKAARADLTPGDYFGNIVPLTTNPETQQILAEILLQPTTGDAEILRLTMQGQNWIAQRDNPAHVRTET